MISKVRDAIVGKVAEEFEEVDLGDPRRDERLLRLAMLAGMRPKASFPKLTRTDADLEGAYRLLGNERVSMDAVLAPHVRKTLERAEKSGVILALHDTTEASFRGVERAQQLGSVTNGASGFFLHTTLAVTADGSRRPLGLLGIRPHTRPAKPKHAKRERDPKARRARQSKEASVRRNKKQSEKESDRWRVAALETQEMLGRGCECIHVMDREADSFSLLASLTEANCRYVVRANHDRTLEEGLKLWDALNEVEGKLFREVTLSRRRFINQRYAKPARSARRATLQIRSTRVNVPRPEAAQSKHTNIPVWVVQVFEPDCPLGEPPVEWTLLTSEPIRNLDDAARVVDWYRARWLIEEFFKCLKTGCSYEERQLESMPSLLNALALFAPIAWALLSLRSAARETPNDSASTIFSTEQLLLLRSLSVRYKLPANPTLQDALLAIAGLGGHLKRNGSPGWQTLGEGYREFLSAEQGWLAARR